MLLAPTLLLNAGSGAAIARPTFSRDFAGEKTLNNGTGPAITFTRASNATYFDANGTLQTAANDAPRFDHSGGSSLGLLIEESRTNSLRNSQAGGSTNGVIGSGGALPTNWASASTAAAAYEIIGTGTEAGLTYIDIKISGTNSTGSAANPAIGFEVGTQIVAAQNQTWTSSLYVSMVAGSTSGVASFELNIVERDSSGNVLGNNGTTFTPTATRSRFSHTRTMASASTGRVTDRIRLTVNDGQTYNLTLRIAAPQLEQGAFPTSYIPTTTAAATRSADSAVVTPISSFYNQSEGTLFAEGSFGRRNIGEGFASLAQETFGRGLNGGLRTAASTANFLFRNSAAPTPNLNEVNDNSANLDGVTIQKMAAAHNSLGHVFGSAIGRSVVSDEADTISPLPVCDRLLIGEHNNNGPTPKLNGHIRKLAYWPRRLSNTLLQQLTT
jgi:hypothetical protein